MKTIDIVLPVYNEALVLRDFHQKLTETLNTLKDKYVFQTIYVLDKSSDGSLDVLKELSAQHANVRVIALSKRFGHQMSLVAGIDHAMGDAVIMMDSDLEHPPAVIPKLLEQYEKGFDVVYTVRTYNEQSTLQKKLFSWFFYKLIRKFSGINVREGAADFRLISRKVAKVFQNNIREQNQFLRGLFPWVGFNSTAVHFVSQQRTHGKTKYNPRRLVNFAILGIISFSKLPLRIAIVVGLVVSFLSVLYGIWVIVVSIFFEHTPEGWTSLFVVMTFIGGMQLFFMGVLGEYIGIIFDEVKRRPLYIVDDIISSK
jgi:glycosyltransferase involved in cell wall biosynthesis